MGPCRGTLHGQCPPALPSPIPVSPGLDTQRVRTHRTKTSEDQTHGANRQKLKSSWGGLCSGSERVPPRVNLWQPPGSSRSSFNSTHKRATSPSIHPPLLGNSLSSFWPPLPPLPGLLSSCFRDPPAPQCCIPYTPTPGCDSKEWDELWDPPVATQTRSGQGGKMESGG